MLISGKLKNGDFTTSSKLALLKLFEQISFDAPDIEDKQICIDAEYVDEQLAEIAQNQDLSRYIL